MTEVSIAYVVRSTLITAEVLSNNFFLYILYLLIAASF